MKKLILHKNFLTHKVPGEELNINPDDIMPIEEVQFLLDTMYEHQAEKVLEIGLGLGISAHYIGKIADEHFVIDLQEWPGVDEIGRKNFSSNNLIEGYSQFELPKLVEKQKRFDMVFIDGDHTFTGCFNDTYYSRYLVNVGGIIVFHDYDMPAVRKVVDYWDSTNRPDFKLINVNENGRLAVLQRIEPETSLPWDLWEEF